MGGGVCCKGLSGGILSSSGYDVDSEAKYFADQSGVFEIVDTRSSHAKAMRQVRG